MQPSRSSLPSDVALAVAAAVPPDAMAGLGRTADLTTCDREPIHLAGAIQPHGVLLALDPEDLTIRRVSANAPVWLGGTVAALLDASADAALPPSLTAAIRDAREELAGLGDHGPATPQRITLAPPGDEPMAVDVQVHRSERLLVVECERAERTTSESVLGLHRSVQRALGRLERAAGVRALAQAIADEVRTITGFDRVMVYRFAEDWHGEVIAEARDARVGSFLGLHFPASDIPQQARALYVRNRTRLIADVGYVPQPILPRQRPPALLAPESLGHLAGPPAAGAAADAGAEPDGVAPLNLAFSALRSVSPVHLEYLVNMGVAASMSISLVRDGRLWGLVACHHDMPRHVPLAERAICETLGQVFATQLAAAALAEAEDAAVQTRRVQAQLLDALGRADDVVDALARHSPSVLELLDAGGAALVFGGDVTLLGRTPSEREVRALVDWLLAEGLAPDEEVTWMEALPTRYAPAAAYRDVASGLLAVATSRARRNFVLWFRPEELQFVDWGGDPAKAVVPTPDGSLRLSPRRSFEAWREAVQGRSRPWTPAEVRVAVELRGMVVDVVLRRAEELAALNTDLARSNAELDDFAYVASHDLKEPLRGLHTYATILMRDYRDRLDTGGMDKLHTLVRLTERMDTLIESLLYYSRVGRTDLAMDEVDLQSVLDGVLERLAVRLAEPGVVLRVPRLLPRVRCDRARVGEVFYNLVSNAIKYNDKGERQVEVGWRDPAGGQAGDGPPAFYVRDNGIGIRPRHHETVFRIFRRLHGREQYGGGTGAGLTIAKKIVERHGGRLWLESTPGEGTTFWFTLAPEGRTHGASAEGAHAAP